MNISLIVSIIFLILAIFKMPYGYYYLLKFVICFVSIKEALLVYDKTQKFDGTVLTFIALALLYNPISKMPLGREIWTIVNVLTIIYFIYCILRQNKEKE